LLCPLNGFLTTLFTGKNKIPQLGDITSEIQYLLVDLPGMVWFGFKNEKHA
jgi:hypothetical protein